jgi:hypothetical protein
VASFDDVEQISLALAALPSAATIREAERAACIRNLHMIMARNRAPENKRSAGGAVDHVHRNQRLPGH